MELERLECEKNNNFEVRNKFQIIIFKKLLTDSSLSRPSYIQLNSD